MTTAAPFFDSKARLGTLDSPIGVYDSGVGGLSVLRAIQAVLPGESFVYIADSGHAPYGNQGHAFLQARAHRIANFVVELGAKALVLACNTISVATAASLRSSYDLPIVAMEPAIKPATLNSHSRVVLVLATANTIQSASVARLCASFGQGVHIILQACPGLADQVERGELDSPATYALLEAYVKPGIAAGADTIVLGCTHYAFLAEQIGEVAGKHVQLLEPSVAVARQLAYRLEQAAIPRSAQSRPTLFYTSGCRDKLGAFLTSVGIPAARIHRLPG
ncbi:glutamate racemase [Methylomonas sp. HYX-M1]|uniref:glutamate racemase n=1 Tax=Methylomonas sp. HYX-M1 TaxID=3139307 RepID=UPI00345C590B